MSWFLAALKQYAIFSGRARRKEYWYFQLFVALLLFGLGLVSNILGLSEDAATMLVGLAILLMLLPGMAVTIRRLHDSGRAGWWVLIGFVPIIGAIILFIFMLMPSDHGDNQFGTNPLDA